MFYYEKIFYSFVQRGTLSLSLSLVIISGGNNFCFSQTAKLSEPLQSFSILAGASVTADSATNVKGTVGAIGTVDATVRPTDTTLQGAVCVTQRAMDSLTSARSKLAAAQPAQSFSVTALGSTTLNSGTRNFSSSVTLSDAITLTGDSTSKFIFNISGSLTFAPNTQIILSGGVKAENVFFNVSSGVLVGDSVTVCGTILAGGTITCLQNISASGARMLSADSVNLVSSRDTLGIAPAQRLSLFGSTCGCAMDLGSGDTCVNNITMTDSVMWFRFTTGNQLSTSIALQNLVDSTLAYVNAMTIYSGTCSSLNLFSYKTIAATTDTSSIIIDTSGFVNGTTYFIKLSANGNASFNLCLRTIQPFCGFDELMKRLRQSDPNFQQRLDSIETALSNYINTPHPLAAPYTIPVVVHVIHNNNAYGTGSNISYKQIKWQIQALNAAYATNYYPAYNGQSNGAHAFNTQIHFCLASIPAPLSASWATDPQNNTECGVMRYSTTNAGTLNPNANGTNNSNLLALSHPTPAYFPFADYLNIWVVPNIPGGVMGWSNLPGVPQLSGLDGIVIRSDVFGDNSPAGNNFSLLTSPDLQQGKILAHEVGHYLELYHTHHPAINQSTVVCEGTTPFNPIPGDPTACNQHGDFCCDTPPTETLNITSCSTVYNTCVELYDPYNPPTYTGAAIAPDQIENFMSYSDDNCMNTFTYNQFQRMDAVLNMGGFRDYLVSAANLIATGTTPINNLCPCSILVANIGFTPSSPCPGTCVTFTTTGGAGAVTWAWNFGDPASGPANTSILQIPPCHTYANPGIYTVTLIVTDVNGNTYTQTATITVAFPTATIVGPSPAPTVCDGSQQCVNIQFIGNPPFNVTLTDGSSNYNLVNISASAICWPVTVSSSNTTFTLNNFSDALCQGNTVGSITFNVQCCGNELWTNGNFQAYTGCLQSPSTTPLLCTNWGFGAGSYSVFDMATGINTPFVWPPFGVVPPMGNCMGIDGPSPLSPPSPLRKNLICQQINITAPGNYLMSFFVSEGSLPNGNNPSSLPYPFEMGVSVGGTVLGQAVVPTKSITNPLPTTWVPINFQIPNLNMGLQQVCVCQTTYDGGSGYDYALDNISFKAMAPVATIVSFTNETCAGKCNGTATSSATSGTLPYTFSWNTTPVQTGPNAVGLCPGNYAVTVTDANNCTATANVTINQGFPLPTIVPSLSPPSPICLGQSINLSASGGSTYSWTGPNLSCPTCTTGVFPPLGTNVYTVIGTDANGCTNTAQVTVVVNPLPNITISPSNPAVCAGGSTALTASGGTSYAWTTGANIVCNTCATTVVTPVVGNNVYTVIGTDANGCTNTAQITITINPLPVVSITPSSITNFCPGQPATVTAIVSGGTGPYTYLWSTSATLPSITITTVGTYVVTVTDANGCTGTASLNVSVATCFAAVTITNVSSSSFLPATGFTSTTIAINGTFTIDNNFTFSQCTLLLAPGAKIVIPNNPTYFLSVLSSNLSACQNCMWDGIYVNGGSAGLNIRSSYIRDAQNAVVSLNGGLFTITSSTFDLNYKHVVAQTSSLLVSPANVSTSNFICNGTLINPYIGKRTLRGFEITDADAITIGVAGTSPLNTFDNADIGIFSTNSNVTVINDLFNNIQQTTAVAIPICCALGTCPGNPACNPPPVGFAIHATGNPTGSPNRTLIVGGILPTQKCTLQFCTNGIFARQNINVNVQNNIFNNVNSSSLLIPSSAINVTDINNKNVLIKGNKLNNAREGVVFSFSNNTNANISNNQITVFSRNAIRTLQTINSCVNIGFNSINGGYPSALKTGILLQNAVAILGTCSNTVHDNTILGVPKGILGTNIPNASIGSINKIYFIPILPPPSNVFYGIRIQNSSNVSINQNLVQRNGANPTSLYTTQVFGISSETSPLISVTNNETKKVGTGIRFFGNHLPYSTVQCNILDRNQRGLTLENTDIGDQGTSSHASDNQWDVFSGRDADIRGIPAITQRTWYIQSFSLPYGPQIINPGSIVALQSAPSQNTCSNPCFDPVFCKQLKLVAVVKETPPINQMNSISKFLAKQTAFGQLRADTSLMHLGTPEDTVLQNFYDSIMNTNL